MNILSCVMMCFSILGAVDCMLNNRFGIGKEWERGFYLLGTMALTIVGMVVLAPYIAFLLKPILNVFSDNRFIDPSIIGGMLLANDMGGASLASSLAIDSHLGLFNGLVVASMMGCTVSFTLPFALGIVEKRQHRELLMGLMFGIVTIPIGCFVAGLVARIPIVDLLFDIIPLIIVSVILTLGLLKKPEACIKVFSVFGIGIKLLITIGLVVGMIGLFTKKQILPHTAPIEEGALIIFNASVVLSGAFPCVNIISRLLRKPLGRVGKKLGINNNATMGLVASLATSATTFGMMKNMDDKGTVLNSAFAVSGAFTFASHLAFTISIDSNYLQSMIVGKLVGGLSAIALVCIIYPRIKFTNKDKHD